MSDDKPGNVVELASAFEKPAKEVKGRRKEAPKPAAAPPGDEPGVPETLPHDCPVQALGTLEGDYFFLDSLGQLRRKKEGELGRLPILSLFGGNGYLILTWPVWREVEGRWVRKKDFNHGALAPVLIQSCSDKGVWDPTNRVRGCGSWMEEDGDLVMHCGQHLWRAAASGKIAPLRDDAGLQGELLYPRRPPLPEPDFKKLDGIGDRMLDQLETWSFKRGDLDRLIVLGWIVCSMMGQALVWRPMMWVTGSKNTGKSTLERWIEILLGDRAAVKPSGTSQAYVYQTIGDSSLPVLLDEFEAKEDNKRVQDVIELMRIAASGGELGRGGSDNNPKTYTLKSCFAAFSILMPPLTPQDRSRMAIVELRPLKKRDDSVEFDFQAPDDHDLALGDLARWRLTGRQLRGRILTQWPRYRQTYRAYFQKLLEAGFDHRAASQFGSLGAGQDMARFDALEISNVAAFIAMMPSGGLSETRGYLNEPEGCMQYLLAAQTDEHRHGARETISHYLQEARRVMLDNTGTNDPEAPVRVLAKCGIRLYQDATRMTTDDKFVLWVFVSSTHPTLLEIFRNTHWKGRPGSPGAWAQALRGHEGAADKAKEMKIDGKKHWGTAIMWEGIFPESTASEDEKERET